MKTLSNLLHQMRSLSFLAVAGLAFFSVSCQEKEVPATVSLTTGSATESSLTFSITSTDADEVCYSYTEAGQPALSEDQIFQKGKKAVANETKEYTISSLDFNKSYDIYAVAKNSLGYSPVAKITMKTAVPGVSVSVKAGTTTPTSIEFTVSSSNVKTVAWMCVKSTESVPSADKILSSGTKVEGGKEVKCTVEELEPNTEFTVVAAASDVNGENAVASEPVKISTAEVPVPAVSVKAGENVTISSIEFTVTSSNAKEVAWQCVEASEKVPAAETILSKGQKVNAGETVKCVAEGLKGGTEYIIVAAASDILGKNPVVSEQVKVTTEKPAEPQVGDYYYSDGTFSTALDPSKTPIAIIFHVGLHEKDDIKDYKQKDGITPMTEIKAYAVALKDPAEMPESGVSWSYQGSWDNPCGGSRERADYKGYFNSCKIVENAKDKNKYPLTDKSDNYPAGYYSLVKQEKDVPAPAASSGWFLPSVLQLKDLTNFDTVADKFDAKLLDVIEKAFKALGDKAVAPNKKYWSSTEAMSSGVCEAYLVNFDTTSSTIGSSISERKDWNKHHVRAIIAF